MKAKAAFVFFLVMTTLGHPYVSRATPPFSVITAGEVHLTDAQVRGRPFLLWYEASDTIHVNDAAKAELAKVLTEAPDATRAALVAVGDLSSYDYWPARSFAKRELRDCERFYGHPVYADWSGSMRTSFGLQKGLTNLLFVDAAGVVRYRGTGKISRTDVDRVRALLQGKS
jgi:hypothetical protein